MPLGTAPGRDPFVDTDEARLLGPCPTVILPGDLEAKLVVDHELARRLLTSRLVSRDARLHWPGHRRGTGQRHPLIESWVGTENALNSYGEQHSRLRGPIARALSRGRIERMTGVITSVADNLLDRIGSSVQADVVEDFAMRLPLVVTAKLLGIEERREEAFRRATAALFDTSGLADAAESQQAISDLLQGLIATKQERPGDDLATDLLREAHATRSAWTAQQLHDQLMLVIAAGIETTVHGIGSLIVNLLRRPEQLHLIRSGQATWDQACEESLRFRGPAGAVPLRFAVEDIHDTVTGEKFEKGQPILIDFGAAGRDWKAHGADADQFNIMRKPAPHLAFGAGPHFCAGAALARREITVAAARWFARFPASQLAVPAESLTFVPSWIVNGYIQIPVLLGAGADA
ncbi:cytochrome P450 [Streptomyces sp. BE147]|uniref:cytochrome P450 n=1 Tax=Streptomyces sp. BE147 TaxID=3002524 RepID=UPI002E77B372|nr:cytochrome P450 [Streptomyces sp. BE147]MEE1737046.1 cytochrome P450 [Streptomyces sp. BE147]